MVKGHSNNDLNVKQLHKDLGHFLLSGGATKFRFITVLCLVSEKTSLMTFRLETRPDFPSETSTTLPDMKSLPWSIVGKVIKLTKQKLKVFILTWLCLKKQESE